MDEQQPKERLSAEREKNLRDPRAHHRQIEREVGFFSPGEISDELLSEIDTLRRERDEAADSSRNEVDGLIIERDEALAEVEKLTSSLAATSSLLAESTNLLEIQSAQLRQLREPPTETRTTT